MKLTYKQRIFFYFLLIFILFGAGMIFFEQNEEKSYRTQALESSLDNYTEIIHSYIVQHGLAESEMTKVDTLLEIMPANMRVTIMSREGKVLFDNDIKNISSLENHLDRPEIRRALYQGSGSNIRLSTSLDKEYLYYAKFYTSYYVRVALPYDVETKSILSPDRLFIYIALGMFLVVLLLLNYVAGRFGKSIGQLKNFTIKVKEGKQLPENVTFPDDELGEIGKELFIIFGQKEKAKRQVELEKEKLIRHFRFSEEGLAVFNADFTKVYANSRFIQYLNFILDKLSLSTDDLFTSEVFRPVQQFLNDVERKSNHFSMHLNESGKYFNVQAVIFEDKSFEITITDITQSEKTRLLKQEMSNNIAHELRTPVTSLRAYLETLDGQNLPPEKQHQFVHRAYMQSVRLSNLVEDVSLISKIEESAGQFKSETIGVAQLLNEVRIDLVDKLENSNVKLNVSVPAEAHVKGNYTLLYSIFRNLIDNSIDHGGRNIQVFINNYMEDDKFLYFSYYDTGKGVEEKHLKRLFERFYRVGEGRTRDSGGSGLGLSIVKNAVLFHQGEIQVKNRKDAGLEFLFTLRKN